MSSAGSSEHWMAVTFRVWVLKSYSSWGRGRNEMDHPGGST